MEKKLFFSAESAHGSDSSMGFANDTIVYAWSSKKTRDEYVADCKNISCQAIKKTEVTAYATNWSTTNNCNIKPRPFTAEFWGIVDVDIEFEVVSQPKPAGLVGEVRICDECEYHLIRRLY